MALSIATRTMPLFHYTRTESAFKIIESGVLHATHWKYLNDGSEMDAVKPLLRKIFSEEFEEEGTALIKAGILKQKLIEDHGRRVYSDEAEKMINIAYGVTNDHMPVFISSLCRHEEGSDQARDGLLSQWRGYGVDGGCALEFDENKLQAKINKEAQRFACMHVSLEDVEYHNHERILRDVQIDGLAKAILRQLAGDNSQKTAQAISDGMDGFQLAIGKIAPKLKHSAFSEERETRIILPCMSPEAAKQYPNRKVKPIKLRFRSGLPIPYVEVFEGKKPLPITRIIIGPQRRQGEVAYTVKLALKARGIKAQVDCSSIPLVE